jgi:D-alanyl-D-alanine carboxypeptidase/D-alanyl-D-alanine-endopeptidase (penicillin-binding protein 4)
MKKLFLVIIMALFCVLSAQSKAVKSNFEDVIKESGVDTNSISVSIKDVKTGKSAYSLNDKFLMNPASVQKIITTTVALDELGENYKFKTQLYARGENEYLIKLGADPYLTSDDIKKLVKDVKPDAKRIYLDDSILDNKTWGEGWQWDDDMNISMPRFGAYNLDKNIIKITVMPSETGNGATIINTSKYPLVFYNNVTKAAKTDIHVTRDGSVSANAIVLSGTVARSTVVYIPILNLKQYFDVQLTKALEANKVYLKEPFVAGKKLNTDVLKSEIVHELNISDILKQSNNMIAETVFKIAGGKHAGNISGTDLAGIKMVQDYCQKNKLDYSRIRIADGSGVSKNNLISADFVTEFLMLNKENPVLNNLPTSGEGTLTLRMLPLKNNLRAKTGTLSNISSIAGYLTSKSGNKYVFCIITNDMQLSNSDKKMLEDYIIREAYIRL